MYSCARWIGLRVWNPTTLCQPRASNSAREARGSSRKGAAAASMGIRDATRTGPASAVVPWA